MNQNGIKEVLAIAHPTEIRLKYIYFNSKRQLIIDDINLRVSTNHEYINSMQFCSNGNLYVGGTTGIAKKIDFENKRLKIRENLKV